MGTLTMTYGDASLWAALAGLCMAIRHRFGMSPIPAAQGTSVPFAGRQHTATNHLVAVKADDRFRPRGRRL